MLKQVIVFRADLLNHPKITQGKIAGQIAHASMRWLADRAANSFSLTENEKLWLTQSMTKIIVTCADEREMLFIAESLKTAKTLAQYEAQGKALFDAQLLALNNKRADPAATSSFPTTITVVDALIQSVTKASGIFSTSINGGGSDLAILYRNALIAAKNSISEDQRLNPQALRTPYATNVISAFTRQLEAAAFDPSKTDALIAGGYTPTQAQLLSVDLKNARAAAVTGATEAKKPETKKCSVLGTDALIGCIDQAVTWIIKNTILQIGGFFVWLTANMFNYAVKIGILQFAKWAPDQLYPIWLIVRQIISLFIVFIGLYLGLMYILGKDEKFQKYIPWVIMFALFVNFSYPLVRTAIDISNIVSLKIYASAVGPGALDENPTNTAGAQILDKLGLQGLLMSATATKDGDGGLKKFMHWITTTHTRKYHALTKTVGGGHLYQGRYKSFIVENDLYLHIVLKYIERNPVRAKLVQKCEDWQWGSAYRRTLGTVKEKKLLHAVPIDLPSNYHTWINTDDKSTDLVSIRNSLNRGVPYGGESWKEKMIKEYNLGSTVRLPGRPRTI
jgi:peptidyl-tRNA hydrolase